jgi:UDP-GlcNAc:undecaprenyl-phosphate GlcNAc-1-phosphate transferase
VALTALGTALAWGTGIRPALLVAVLLSLAIGTVDDLFPLSPLVRVTGLLAVGGVLAAAGVDVAPLAAFAGPATVVLVVASANAVNLLDGQDGLAGGLATIAALGLAAILWGGGAATAAFASAGALAGFVFWNRPRARIFLGNGGSYAVGTMLAAFAALAASKGWPGLFGAALCLMPFAFELGFTVLRRLITRHPLVSGDRLHGYDLLSTRLGRWRTTLLLWAGGVVTAGLGWAVSRSSSPVAGSTVAAVVCLVVVGGVRLWTSTRLRAGAAIEERTMSTTSPVERPGQHHRTDQEGSA